MTQSMLDTANNNISWHMKQFGYDIPNVEFKHGYIESLSELGLEMNSFDVIISNCVVNLSPDKEAVLAGSVRANIY